MSITPKPDPALIQKIIEASNYIAKNTRRSKACWGWVPIENIQMYADSRGLTFDQAEDHLRLYFSGGTNEF